MFSSTDLFATSRCRYPSKFCPNARTQKRNGELHRFCEEHRAKANDNQKRWSSTRQRQWDAMEYQAAVAAAAAAHGSQLDPRAIHGNYTNLVAGSFPVGSPVPQPVTTARGAQRSMFTTTTASSRVVTRTPSQADQYLTHLLFRNQSSSETDEHISAVAATTGHSHS